MTAPKRFKRRGSECPVCGKIATDAIFNEHKQRWEFKHADPRAGIRIESMVSHTPRETEWHYWSQAS